MSTTKNSPPRWALWVAVIAALLFLLLFGRKIYLYLKAKKAIKSNPDLLNQAQATANATGVTTEQAIDSAARAVAMRQI